MKEKQTAKKLSEYLRDSKTVLPKPIDISELATAIVSWHEKHEGSTHSLYFGNQIGEKAFAVSLYNELSVRFPDKTIPREIIQRFIEENIDLLTDPRISIGTWYNRDDDSTYIDVIALVSDKKLAVQLAKQYNQIAIFDLFKEKQIDTGGTGIDLTISVRIEDRLPKLRREAKEK